MSRGVHVGVVWRGWMALVALLSLLVAGPALAQANDEPTGPIRTVAAEGRVERSSRVLVVGDSHTYQTFGQSLDTLLRSHHEMTVTTFGSCGAGVSSFLRGRRNRLCTRAIDEEGRVEVTRERGATAPLPHLLDRQPDAVVIALGANNLHRAYAEPEMFRRHVRRMVAMVWEADARCLWIGPPDGANKPPRKLAHLYRILAEELDGRCALFDSRSTSLPYLDYRRWSPRQRRRWDGAHFDSLGEAGRTLARRWAEDADRWIVQQLQAGPRRGDRGLPEAPEPGWTLDDLDLQLD